MLVRRSIIKILVYTISAVSIISGCQKDENEISKWYLTRTNSGGGMVNLKIEGSTNGDKVTIRTHGDGDNSDENVELDSRKNFNEDIVISFTATSVPSSEFEVSTKVIAYKGTDTLVVPLNSCTLKY